MGVQKFEVETVKSGKTVIINPEQKIPLVKNEKKKEDKKKGVKK